MTPANTAFSIYQGADWEFKAQFQDSEGVPVDLTGYDAEIRLAISTQSAEGFFTAKASDGDIELDDAGNISMLVPASIVAEFPACKCAFLLKLFPPSANHAILTATVEITKQVPAVTES